MLAADAGDRAPVVREVRVRGRPALASGGRIFAAYGMVFDGATGTKLTDDFTMPRMGGALPTVDAERVYISTRCKGAAALNRATLTLAWRGPSAAGARPTTAVSRARSTRAATKTRARTTKATSTTRRPARSRATSRRARRPRSPAISGCSSATAGSSRGTCTPTSRSGRSRRTTTSTSRPSSRGTTPTSPRRLGNLFVVDLRYRRRGLAHGAARDEPARARGPPGHGDRAGHAARCVGYLPDRLPQRARTATARRDQITARLPSNSARRRPPRRPTSSSTPPTPAASTPRRPRRPCRNAGAPPSERTTS